MNSIIVKTTTPEAKRNNTEPTEQQQKKKTTKTVHPTSILIGGICFMFVFVGWFFFYPNM